jgi:hypothetical protein
MIDAPLAAFLQEGLAAHLGTRNANFEPQGARATAIKVEPDGEHLVVYLPKIAADRLLPDLRASRQAAVVVARPTDERSCQVKGEFVSARPARADERPIIAAQLEQALVYLETIGIPRAIFEHWTTWPSTAIRVRATALFEQTPRPGTGEPLT